MMGIDRGTTGGGIARRTTDSGHAGTDAGPGRSLGRLIRIAAVISAAIVIVALVSACGGSKPAYCSDKAGLESSIQEVRSLVTSANLSGLREQVGKIEAKANTLVGSAKSDFPSESSAVKRDVDALVASVKGLQSHASAQDLTKVALNVATAASALKNFSSAADSKCN